jgi:hypothetical protein
VGVDGGGVGDEADAFVGEFAEVVVAEDVDAEFDDGGRGAAGGGGGGCGAGAADEEGGEEKDEGRGGAMGHGGWVSD